ncbi:hypothetical protein [Collimonas fungivorans]|uniref:hypothetical protein n=1 Tax=Collimonas fungivorans TaxID=158899 RepID=UPI0005A277D6|nr:hypothetical protein [Collimonas fungivorans]
MIEYINKRMIDWAAWAKRRDDGGLGFPRSTSYCRLVQSHGDASTDLIVAVEAAMEIEHIVSRFKVDRAHLHAVANWVYLAGDFTMERVAHELGCHRDTVYTRLHQLHVAVMDELHEITIAAEDRVRENKVKRIA